jgi:hypothetical protein
MKYFSLIMLFFILSCANKEDVLLPKASTTIVKNIEDHSSIYLFFRTKGKDTLAVVNRKNSIITTNWILNIDKRLPLRLVIPEVMKLQKRKREEKDHHNALAENYYSYADTIGKNLAFIPFTKVYYTIGKPEKGNYVFHFRTGNDFVLSGNSEIKKSELIKDFYSMNFERTPVVVFLFDKNMSYGEYIQNKILVQKFNSYHVDQIPPKEFIF